IRQGVVFLPMHWGKVLNANSTRANNLTDDRIDPHSKQPNFKFTYVSIHPYKKASEKIVVIGAGAAAFRFVASYRQRNQTDQITVISREPNAFYNRILLPEYISDHLAWDGLEKMSDQLRQQLKFTLLTGCSAQEIDRERKIIRLDNGREYAYDRLVIATGSRPFVPREVPTELPGVFTMRRREDADRLKGYLAEQKRTAFTKNHVLIVGGGLLGLELAAALREVDVQITIIQRSNRLMERQLDPTASRLLAEEVAGRGIQTYFRNEVDTIFPRSETGSLRVTLKSGKVLDGTAVVYAIGTRPNLELGRAAGLTCGRGIVVDDRLRTCDRAIFAIGEVAEWRGQRFGITAAAEQQAEVVANYLAGDLSAVYDGSVLMNILKFDAFDLCSLGEVNPPSDDSRYEEIVFRDTSQAYYKKCVVLDDRLVGAVLLGDKNEFAEFRSLIEDKIELSEKRSELLRSGGQKEPLLGRVVCSCNNVGEGNLAAAIAAGCSDFKSLCQATGAGLGCGSCKAEVQAIFDESIVPV
ncbi:MAG: FAD-dependent oxidoreductase, partial [Bacteroidota bacterium]